MFTTNLNLLLPFRAVLTAGLLGASLLLLSSCGGAKKDKINQPPAGSATTEKPVEPVASAAKTDTKGDKAEKNIDVKKPKSKDPAAGGTISKKQPKWREVAVFKGKKNTKTKPFVIKGEEWKISWKALKGKGEMVVILYDKNDPEFTEIIVNADTEETDYEYMASPGEYYLQVNSTRPFEIKVEDFR